MRTFWTLSVLLLIAGFATGSTPAITDSRQRLECQGFSVLPPQGQNWIIAPFPPINLPAGVGPPLCKFALLKKLIERVRTPGEARSIFTLGWIARLNATFQRRQEFLSFAETLIKQASRNHAADVKARLDNSWGATCVKYERSVENVRLPQFPSSEFVAEDQGLLCIHAAASRFIIFISYSQTFLKGQTPLSVAQDIDPFFKSLEFTSMEEWNSAPWERTLLAARQAKKRESTGLAELYCIQALQYVEESTVKTLYDYAALLKNLGREGAEVAQSRADKLRQVSRQPSGGFLGFAPPEELNKYADLLQELDRRGQAESIRALATAKDSANKIHAARIIIQRKGGDPRGNC